MKLRIYYDDTDIGGVVYYANYLKFIERARSQEVFFDNNLPLRTDVGEFAIKSVQANYFAPATLGDELDIQMQLKKLNKASVILVQSIYIKEKLIFQAESHLAFVKDMKPVKMPENIIKIFNQYPIVSDR
jgi:acyl-CoA thioester hydrolase